MIARILLLSLVFLSSCGSLKELEKQEEVQSKDRKKLEKFIYSERLDVLKEGVLKALNELKDGKKSSNVVINKSMAVLQREKEIDTLMKEQGFLYKNNYYINPRIKFLPTATIKETVTQGEIHLLEDTNTRVIIADGALSYELIKTEKGGTQLHVYRINRIVRSKTKVGVDWWGVFGGKLPFLLKKGAILWEKSREFHGARDRYAELEIHYLLRERYQE
jgi:hypothetical protein